METLKLSLHRPLRTPVSYHGNWSVGRNSVRIESGDEHAKSRSCFVCCDIVGRQRECWRNCGRTTNRPAGVNRDVFRQDAGDLRIASAYGHACGAGKGRSAGDTAAVFGTGDPTADPGTKFTDLRERSVAANGGRSKDRAESRDHGAKRCAPGRSG